MYALVVLLLFVGVACQAPEGRNPLEPPPAKPAPSVVATTPQPAMPAKPAPAQPQPAPAPAPAATPQPAAVAQATVNISQTVNINTACGTCPKPAPAAAPAAPPPTAYAPPRVVVVKPAPAPRCVEETYGQEFPDGVWEVTRHADCSYTRNRRVEPAPEPTPAPAPAPAAAPAAPRCPTDKEMQDAHGFTSRGIKPVATGHGIAWEGCKWTLQHVGFASIDIPLLSGWQYTVTLDDGKQTVAVFYGDGRTARVFGATIRYRPAYNTPDNSWVNNPCELLKREQAFGQDPARGSLKYGTANGNMPC